MGKSYKLLVQVGLINRERLRATKNEQHRDTRNIGRNTHSEDKYNKKRKITQKIRKMSNIIPSKKKEKRKKNGGETRCSRSVSSLFFLLSTSRVTHMVKSCNCFVGNKRKEKIYVKRKQIHCFFNNITLQWDSTIPK